jgi:hypothetical protein
MPFFPASGHPRRRVFAALACLFATGCATLHDLPRAEYAAKPERKGGGGGYPRRAPLMFDLASFSADTLVGQHLKDTEGSFEEYNTVAIPLERVVERHAVRRTNWLRTGVIAGAVAVAAIVGVAANRRTRRPWTAGRCCRRPSTEFPALVAELDAWRGRGCGGTGGSGSRRTPGRRRCRRCWRG